MDISRIKSPADIKALDIDGLKSVAAGLRHALLVKLSRHGGHIGPNLGMVEATVALHYVFDSPRDRIVYDVSHQSYVHKMLTGRIGAFLDPKDYDSVSGYTNPNESEHDMFTIGHTSTSVSLACGLAKARDLKGGRENVIAVIGDGSLSGGEAFEGLDHAAELGTNFIVVVNDNDMSIAENHGGLYRNLHDLRVSDGGECCNYFKSLGFDYLYVADGNDIGPLVEAFSKVKDTDHPVVVHISTLKGKGFAPAEMDKESFHYGAPFDIETGRSVAKGTTENYHTITCGYLLDAMKKDPSVVAITAGTPTVMGFTRDKRVAAGRQFVDVGIAEEHAAALSSGLAKGGCRPFWGVYSTFVQRAYDQISQDICIDSNPAVIGVFLASVDGMNDVTHLGIYDIAMLGNIPGLVYMAPTCKEEYISMLDWAMAQRKYPVAIRVPGPAVVSCDETFDADYDELDRFRIVKEGRDVAIIAVGNMMPVAREAAGLLAGMGVDPTIINPRFLSGIDKDMLNRLMDTHEAVVTIEDGILDGGFGGKIARYYGATPVKVDCIGLEKRFFDRYDASMVKDQARMTPEGVASAAIALLRKKA